MKNPFIPIGKANFAIVAGNASEEIISNLEKKNIRVIKTIKCQNLDPSIAYHPDLVIHPIDHNSLIIAPEVFSYYEKELEGLNLRLIKGNQKLSSKYPGDIAYNVGRLGNYAIHNFKYTDGLLKAHLLKEDLELIDIKQGYSKCSMVIVDEESVITSDSTIYKRLKDLGFYILKIEPGFIELQGQNYGFIGGATGNISKDEIVFSGQIKTHPEKEKIEKFIELKNKKIAYLSKDNIIDIGTVICFQCD